MWYIQISFNGSDPCTNAVQIVSSDFVRVTMSNYAMIDLEMCRIPRVLQPDHIELHNEIIQIGAVLIDNSYHIPDRFSTYVCPQFGTIDDFIEKLTGIGANDVKDAPSIQEALHLFLSWLPDDTTIISWSETDKQQIESELNCKALHIPALSPLFDTWLDCQAMFSEKMQADTKVYRLSEALRIADINFDENEHDGFADAYNTALLFIKMNTDKDFKLSKYYTSEDTKETSTTSLGALFAKLNLSDLE